MEIPLSYQAFLINHNNIEFRYPEFSAAVLLFGFYELLLNDILILELDDNNFFVSSKNNTDNNFYNLLLRPLKIKEDKMLLNKFITRIGIYGYYLSNIFSKHSIKKVLRSELLHKNLLKSKRKLFFKKFYVVDEAKFILNNFDYKNDRENLEYSLKSKLGLNEKLFSKFIEITNIELNRAVNSIGWGINSLGK